MRHLLRSGAQLEIFNNDQDTPLHYAVKNGNKEIVKLLLENNANIDAKACPEQSTPIELAIIMGDRQMVSLMIQNLDVKNRSNMIFEAIKSRNIDMVKTLLEAGVDTNQEDYPRSSPLLHVSELSTENTAAEDYGMIVLLLSYGADLKKRDCNGFTVLHNVASRNHDQSHYDLIEHLLSTGADPNARDRNEATPFCLALENCNPKVAKLFLEHGARADVKNILGRGSMHYAGSQKYTEVIQLLLDNGADISSACDFGMTVLQTSTTHGNLEVIRCLLKCGADLDLNRYDVNGETPLLALLLGYKNSENAERLDEILRLFFVYGADVDQLVTICNESVFQDFFESNTWKILVQHLVVLQESGKLVSSAILAEIPNGNLYQDYYCECLLELAEAKKSIIDGFSVFDILAGDKIKISNYTANEKLAHWIESNWFRGRFPIYESYIEEKLLMGEEYKKLRSNAELTVSSCLFNHAVPYPALQKIVDYLAISDLRKMYRDDI